MDTIGGNITAQLQVNTPVRNEIGERAASWATVQTLTGFLDFQGETTQYERYGAKVEESTHVFVCDYQLIDERAKTENARMLIGGEAYDVMKIDDPMGLHYHLEIFLQYRGGQ